MWRVQEGKHKGKFVSHSIKKTKQLEEYLMGELLQHYLFSSLVKLVISKDNGLVPSFYIVVF